MKRLRLTLILGTVLALSFIAVRVGLHPSHRRITPPEPPPAPFVVAPYLQLGDAPELASPERLTLIWQTEDRGPITDWAVEVQPDPESSSAISAIVTARSIVVDVAEIAPHRLYHAQLTDLRPGQPFAYRVSYQNKVIFQATGRARMPPGVPQRIVAFGDAAADTQDAIEVALQIARAEPDLIVMTGDIVYMAGTIRDYRRAFFPVFNAASPSRNQGAPLLRAIPFAAVPGNHDVVLRDLDKLPDALAYFHIWDLPLNGPIASQTGPAQVTGSAAHLQAFREAAGPAYPEMANYSFNAGDIHFIALDMNSYTDWTNPVWRKWLIDDLAAAQAKPWRIVLTHQPPFSSSFAHADEQRARLVTDILQEGHVHLVLSGHVHNYQRTYPLTFQQTAPMESSGRVPGTFVFDRQYNGLTQTTPKGLIYVVTGAGGARLYNTEQDVEVAPRSWQPFTQQMISREHSLTILDVTPEVLDIKQVNGAGKEIDRFKITR